MRIKQKLIDTQDQKTKLTRQFDQLLKLHRSKLSELCSLDTKIQQQRLQNKTVSQQYSKLKFKLADAFLEMQGVGEKDQPEVKGFEEQPPVGIDHEKIRGEVEQEQRRVILEVTRQEEQYLVRQIKEMKAKTNPMNLAVNVKEYLNQVRKKQAQLETACQKLQKKIDQEAHIQAAYRRLFPQPI